MREVLAGRLSVGELIALYEQAQDYVFARVKEAAQEPVHASREEIRRAVQEVSREICGNG